MTRGGSLDSLCPMGRPRRADDGGLIDHVLNRANARMTIFGNDGDYEAFERVLEEAVDRTRTRLLAYCVMPNHCHLIVWPRQDGELSRFVGWVTLTHTRRRGLGGNRRQWRDRGLLGCAQKRAEASGDESYYRGTGCHGPCPQLLRLHQVEKPDRGQPAGHASFTHRLPRGGARLDAGPQSHARRRSGAIPRRRPKANRLRSRAAREPWCL